MSSLGTLLYRWGGFIQTCGAVSSSICCITPTGGGPVVDLMPSLLS